MRLLLLGQQHHVCRCVRHQQGQHLLLWMQRQDVCCSLWNKQEALRQHSGP
jgi:hypothetical protein